MHKTTRTIKYKTTTIENQIIAHLSHIAKEVVIIFDCGLKTITKSYHSYYMKKIASYRDNENGKQTAAVSSLHMHFVFIACTTKGTG